MRFETCMISGIPWGACPNLCPEQEECPIINKKKAGKKPAKKSLKIIKHLNKSLLK